MLDRQKFADLARRAARDEMYGFGYDFHRWLAEHYRKVTPAEVVRVGRKYLGRGCFVLVATRQPQQLQAKAIPGADWLAGTDWVRVAPLPRACSTG